MTDKIRVKEHERSKPEKTDTKTEPVNKQPTAGVETITSRGEGSAKKGVEIVGGSPGNPKEKGVEIHSARGSK